MRVAGNLDQRQVGRAAATSRHQHQVGGAEGLVQIGAVPEQPVVEGRLKVLPRRRRPRPACSAAARVRLRAPSLERRRARSARGVCSASGASGKARVQAARTWSGSRRRPPQATLRHIVRRPPRQDRCGAVHARVRQPASGAAHQTSGTWAPKARVYSPSTTATSLADDGRPRSATRPAARSRRDRTEGSSSRAAASPGPDGLGDCKQPDRLVTGRGLRRVVGIRDHGVAGAEA